jgi:putative transposase
MKIREDDKWKIAFVTPLGCFEYNIMPFGAVSAPGEYRIFIETVLSGLLALSITVYTDDILYFADTLDEIAKNVLNLLFALRSGPLCYSLSPADCTRLKRLNVR